MTMAMTTERTGATTLLHRVLQADAAVCAVSGVALVVASGPIGRLFELSAGLLLGAGVVLLLCAAFIGRLGTMARVPRRGVLAVIALNVLWAVDSVAILLLGWIDPNAAGTWVVVVQAILVLAVAELQYTALRRTRT